MARRLGLKIHPTYFAVTEYERNHFLRFMRKGRKFELWNMKQAETAKHIFVYFAYRLKLQVRREHKSGAISTCVAQRYNGMDRG